MHSQEEKSEKVTPELFLEKKKHGRKFKVVLEKNAFK